MRKQIRTQLLIMLIFAVLLGLYVPVRAETPVETPFLLGEEYTLSADETTFANGLIQAAGTVRFQTGGAEVSADAMTIDSNQGLVQARGKVTLTSPGNRVTGDDLVYNWRLKKGSLQHVSMENSGYRIQAETGEFDLSTEIIVLKEASFTRCDLPKPDYRFLASRLVVKKSRLTAQGVSLELFGLRLLPVLPLSIPLTPERLRNVAEEHLPLPVLARDGDGIVGELGQMNTLDDRTLVVGSLGFSTESGVLVKGDLYRLFGKDGLLELQGEYKPALQQGYAGAQITWLETNSFLAKGEWGTQRYTTEDKQTYTRYYWPHLTLVFPQVQVGAADFTFSGETGRLSETQVGGAALASSSSFSTAKLELGTQPVPLGSLTLKGKGLLEHDWYGTGNQRFLWETQVSLEKPVAPGLTLELAHNMRQVAGTTPFLSQAVSSLQTVDLGLNLKLSNADVNGSLRYDLDRGIFSEARTSIVYPISPELKGEAQFTYLLPEQKLSGGSLSLIKDLHCFDFEVTYDLVQDQFGTVFRYKF